MEDLISEKSLKTCKLILRTKKWKARKNLYVPNTYSSSSDNEPCQSQGTCFESSTKHQGNHNFKVFKLNYKQRRQAYRQAVPVEPYLSDDVTTE